MNNLSSVRVVVGMSGGVDSSVAALLLLQQGYHVEGLFMKNWDEDDGTEYCTAKADLADAQYVCNRLGIKLHTANFADEYWDNVFSHCLHEYQAGRTPNPDILCNREIKFKTFLDYSKILEANYIATGHYVRKQLKNQNCQLLKGLDGNKDQSYFLYAVDSNSLAQSLFPIGEMTKSNVRALARYHGLANHDKRDSTGICFIGERRFKDFLQQYLPVQPGFIRTTDGVKVGHHDGLTYHTIGQRQGLGIGGLRNYATAPWYVIDKNLATNELVVAQGKDHPRLFKSTLQCQQVHWIAGCSPELPYNCHAKIRYRQADQYCTIKQLDKKRLEVTFQKPQRAITSGQSIVFYDDNICLGGAIID